MNSLKLFLHAVGMDDGKGSTSSQRFYRLLVVVAWLGTKFYNAHLTQLPITWDAMDLGMLGVIFGSGVVQNHVENQGDKTT